MWEQFRSLHSRLSRNLESRLEGTVEGAATAISDESSSLGALRPDLESQSYGKTKDRTAYRRQWRNLIASPSVFEAWIAKDASLEEFT